MPDETKPQPPISPTIIQMPAVAPATPPLTYTRKVLIAVAISLAALLLIAFIYFTAQLLILCFAGMLFSVFLSAPADLLSKRGHMSRNYALLLVLGSLFCIVVAGGYFLGSRIYNQGVTLSRTLPIALAEAEHDLYKYLPAPRDVDDPTTTAPATLPTSTPDPGQISAAPIATTTTAPAPTTQKTSPLALWLADKIILMRQTLTDLFLSQSFVNHAGGLLSSTFGILGNLFIVFGLGVFFALSPGSYSRGLFYLLPPPARPRAQFILSQISAQLQWWFVGQSCSMLTVGTLVFLGLSILGVPMAFTLAIIAGLLNFIPYVGPVCAGALGILIAFAPSDTQTALNPHLALWALALYVAIQLLDAWVFTPFYQRRAVNMPPAFIVIAQIGLSLILGPLGLILATPILASIMVLLRTLYIEDILGDTSLRTPVI